MHCLSCLIASWKTSFYSKGSLDQLSAKIMAGSWHDTQLSFLPMRAGWRLPVKCHFFLQRRRRKPFDHRAAGPKESSSEALAHSASFNRHLFCSARGASRINLSFHRNFCLFFFLSQWWCMCVEQSYWKVLQSHHPVSFKFSLKNCSPCDGIEKPVFIRTIWSNWIFLLGAANDSFKHHNLELTEPGSGYFGPIITHYFM